LSFVFEKITLRDFVVLQITRWNDGNDHSKGFIQINKSITYDKIPEKPQTHVRGKRALVLISNPVPNEPNWSTHKLITFTDLGLIIFFSFFDLNSRIIK